MKRIIKGQEPSEWTYHRLQPQADYDSADAESKEALRLSLLRDQGFVKFFRLLTDNNINKEKMV